MSGSILLDPLAYLSDSVDLAAEHVDILAGFSVSVLHHFVEHLVEMYPSLLVAKVNERVAYLNRLSLRTKSI